MMTRRAHIFLVFAVMSILVLQLVGCGAGYRSSTSNGHEKVYRVDEQGNKTLVYEVAKDGTVTIHDENDPRAQQVIAAQQRADMVREAEADRIERIMMAPKRATDDPIFVALHQTQLDDGLQEAQHSDGAVFTEFRKHFETDPVIELVSEEDMRGREWAELGKALAGKSPNEAPAADIEVVSRGYLKEVAGINRQTGKPGKMVAVVFEATITCNFAPAEYTVTESGNIFRNTEVTKKFADHIKEIIKSKIGPTIPADRGM